MRRKCLGVILAVSMLAALTACGGDGSGGGASEAAAGSGTTAAKAAEPDENGNYLVNGSFEEPDFTGWTITNVDDVTEEIDVYDRDTDCFEGLQSLHFYSGSSNVNFTAEQEVTGLEEGSYKLTAHIQGDAAGDENAAVYFYAIVDGEEVKTDGALNGYVNWYTAEIPGLAPTDGTITVGVSVSAGVGAWGTVDDFTLVKE